MKVIMEGDAKEIAALVLAIQERQSAELELTLDGEKLSQALFGASHDTPEASSS